MEHKYGSYLISTGTYAFNGAGPFHPSYKIFSESDAQSAPVWEELMGKGQFATQELARTKALENAKEWIDSQS